MGCSPHIWLLNVGEPMDSPRRFEPDSIRSQAVQGDRSALNEWLPIVYEELRHIARTHLVKRSNWRDWSSCDLVNKAYVKLLGNDELTIRSRSHLFALSSRVMRQLLVDHARQKFALKAGGDKPHFQLDEQQLKVNDPEHVLAVDEALHRLQEQNPYHAEIVELRFFGGMTVDEVAEYLGVSSRTIQAEWAIVRAWLRRELTTQNE